MELRVLRYFMAVAHEGTISGAADVLHLTQPTLSKQIADLERELGCTLLKRGKRGTTLTNDGRLFLERARDIVQLADKTTAEFGSATHEEVWGDVYLGCGETRAMDLLACAARRMREHHPRVRIHLTSGDAEDLLERLDQGLFDFTLLCGSLGMERYDYLRLPWNDTWGLLMPAGSPLATHEHITPADLTDLPLLFPKQTFEHNDLAGWLGNDIAALNIVMTYSLVWNAACMARRGLGYALALDGLVSVDEEPHPADASIPTSESESLVFRPLEPRVESPVHLVWRARHTHSRAADTFLTYLRSVCQEPVCE